MNQLNSIRMPSKHKKIAIILPQCYSGGTFNGMIAVLEAIANIENTDVVLALTNLEGYSDEQLEIIHAHEAEVREVMWEKISHTELEVIYGNLKKSLNLTTVSDYYSMPVDNFCGLTDCDLWILISDRLEFAIAPLIPYVTLIYDCIQRYIPELFDGGIDEFYRMATVRNSKRVIATTKQTLKDIKNYIGVSEEKLFLLQTTLDSKIQDSDVIKLERQCLGKALNYQYMIWTTNLAVHKNHFRMLKAIEHYVSSLNGELKVVVTGSGVDRLFLDGHVHPHLMELHRYYEGLNDKVKESIIISGELNTDEYYQVLKKARFLIHPCLIDNGTFTVVEAACVGTPSLTSDYPQMREISEAFQIEFSYMNQHDFFDIAKSMKIMERKAEKIEIDFSNIDRLKSKKEKSLIKLVKEELF